MLASRADVYTIRCSCKQWPCTYTAPCVARTCWEESQTHIAAPLWQRRSTHPARTLMHAANAPRRGDHAQISSTTHRSSTGRRTPSGIPGHTQHIPIRPRSDTQPPMLEAVQHPQPRTIRPTDNSPARNTRPSHSISHPTWKPCAGALTRCSRVRPSQRRWKNSPHWKMIDIQTARKPARPSGRTGFFLFPAAHQPRRMSTETRCTLAFPMGKAGSSSLDTATGSTSARSDGTGIASPSRCAARK